MNNYNVIDKIINFNSTTVKEVVRKYSKKRKWIPSDLAQPTNISGTKD